MNQFAVGQLVEHEAYGVGVVDEVLGPKELLCTNRSGSGLIWYTIRCKPASFPIAADKDPWRESEPDAPPGQSECRARHEGPFVCTRAPLHVGHHVARDVDNDVLARWPQEAPAKKRGPVVGMRVRFTADVHHFNVASLTGVIGHIGSAICVDIGAKRYAVAKEYWGSELVEDAGPRVGDEVVRTDAQMGAGDCSKAGDRGAVIGVTAENATVRHGRAVTTVLLRNFSTYFVSAAEWDAMQARKTEPCPAPLVGIDGDIIGKAGDFTVAAIKDKVIPVPGIVAGKPLQLLKVHPDSLNGDLNGHAPRYVFTDSLAVKLAIAMFEEDNAGTIARVTDGGKQGSIGVDDARQRLVWMSTEPQRKAYLSEARALLKRVGELP